ncbi:XcbB/CpsF family capsular polysaccharide biosynthesis protein [Arthrobacter sp. zg-ZUI227]|nr:XcbB/CpsF family capsular polysaccharide biosynthesis protein [Arthrobacter jiangjiafuii]
MADLIDDLKTGEYKYIHLSDPENLLDNRPLLLAAHRNSKVKNIVIELAKMGYYVYHMVDGVARFVLESHIPQMWHSVREGQYLSSPDGVVYSFQEPKSGGPIRNMVVVFSSIGGDIFGNGLSRYFTQNFRSIQKHVPADTAILRIADIGGVVGSFYLDTHYAPRNTKRVGNLIESMRIANSLDKDSVITYGASKGATGALFHAINSDYRCVCVEPIVNDHYYETRFGDTHFTAADIFVEKKEHTFARAIETYKRRAPSTSAKDHESRIIVVYSTQSPQAPYLREIIGNHLTKDMSLIDFRHPQISDHPDVSPQSLNLVTMYLNMMCYGIPSEGGHFEFSCEAP